MSDVYGPRIISGVVVDRPFMARVEAALERKTFFGTRRKAFDGEIARDSFGRLRQEYRDGGKVVAVSIADSVAKKLYIVDSQNRPTATVSFPSEASSEFRQPLDADVKRVENMDCFRIAIPGVIEEGWVSPELQHVVLEHSLSDGKRSKWRMYDIRVGEPDPNLFRIHVH